MDLSARRLIMIGAALAVCALGIVVLVDDGGSQTPPVATTPEELSAQLISNDAALREAIDGWRATGGDPPATPEPAEVSVPAQTLQEAVRLLAARRNLARSTLPLLPVPLRGEVRDLTIAARKLRRLSHGIEPKELRTGAPPPLSELVGYYREAKQRHGVGLKVLAAVHQVETKFGRVKSDSVAGAKGPMQFIPSTWKIYGKGGDIQDPHDAIVAAANLLRQNGAPRDYARALYSYNPSRLYVAAVLRYAAVIGRDPYALPILYCWLP